MIKYCTPIDMPMSSFNVTYRDCLILIGSCFADNIGQKMRERKLNVEVNPFGVLYNPLSVASACRRLLKPNLFVEGDLFFYNGLYSSFMHHGKFSDICADDCLDKINGSLTSAAEAFSKMSKLVITFGTAYVYRLKEQLTTQAESTCAEGHIRKVVANCHKLPAARFERELLTVDMIVDEWVALLEDIWSVNPSLKVVFTVSPIRHLKDGAHLNQISKAMLLLAVQQLENKYSDRISYFPAYELMMDELRDYRFYADNMLHPSKIAIDYIWERFCGAYMDAETTNVLKEVESINSALNHRSLNPATDAYKHFLMQTMLKIEQLLNKYPYLCLSSEKKEIASKLQK